MTADDWAEKAPRGALARAAARREGRSPARHAHDRRRRLDVGAAAAWREALGVRACILLGETPESEPETPEAEVAEPANQKCYLLNADGGDRGNPLGLAAIGALLRTRRLVTVAQISKAIGPATHNVAEYHALIEGLKLAREHGVQRIRVYMDSELVVDQVNGDSAVREAHLADVHKQAMDLVDQFKSFRISWVPRELNAEADRLVNDALGASA